MLAETELVAVREGRMTFDAFARKTREEWRAIAKRLHRRWKNPTWIDPLDIEQELLIAAWLFIPKFDPSRGVGIAAYVRWNATDKAKKKIHNARGAVLHGNADSNPSRIDRPFDLSLVESDSEEGADVRTAKRFAVALSEEPTQEDDIYRKQRVEQARTKCKSTRERLALAALLAEHGDAAEAAMVIFDDPDARLACRMNSEEHAVEIVRDSVRAVVKRLN